MKRMGLSRAETRATVLCPTLYPWLISNIKTCLIVANRYAFMTPTQTLTCNNRPVK